jgi:hypothetical protein
MAADVAAATVGFANDWHIPKGAMLTMGLLSMMLPIAIFIHFGRMGSMTENVPGAIPNVHCSIAP